MRYLFDTHIILWALINSDLLSEEVREIVNDKNNEIFFSTVSTWEIEIKHQKFKKFKLSGEQFSFLCEQNGLSNIQIHNRHVHKLKELKKKAKINHNDPFDKMLLAQSLSENLIFVTHDVKFKAYDNNNIKIV